MAVNSKSFVVSLAMHLSSQFVSAENIAFGSNTIRDATSRRLVKRSHVPHNQHHSHGLNPISNEIQSIHPLTHVHEPVLHEWTIKTDDHVDITVSSEDMNLLAKFFMYFEAVRNFNVERGVYTLEALHAPSNVIKNMIELSRLSKNLKIEELKSYYEGTGIHFSTNSQLRALQTARIHARVFEPINFFFHSRLFSPIYDFLKEFTPQNLFNFLLFCHHFQLLIEIQYLIFGYLNTIFSNVTLPELSLHEFEWIERNIRVEKAFYLCYRPFSLDMSETVFGKGFWKLLVLNPLGEQGLIKCVYYELEELKQFCVESILAKRKTIVPELPVLYSFPVPLFNDLYKSNYINVVDLFQRTLKKVDHQNAQLVATLKSLQPILFHTFWLALKKNNLELLKLILLSGANVNHVNENGETPLHYSIKEGNILASQLLIENGADVNQPGRDRVTPLYFSIKERNIGNVQFLLDNGADVDQLNYHEQPPLYYSSLIEITQLLLNYGANINQVDRNGESPLIHSIRYGRIDISKLLIEKRANINQSNYGGETPLIVSILNNNADIVRLLVEKRADVNQPTSRGVTPLHFSSQNGNIDIAKFLIENGANVNQADKNGATPLHSIKDGKIAQLLIQKGAEVNQADNNGATPLHYSISKSIKIAQFLIENGANVNQADKNGKTPLHYSIRNIKIGFVQLLIDNGCDVHQADNNGITPLNDAIGLNQSIVNSDYRKKSLNYIIEILEDKAKQA